VKAELEYKQLKFCEEGDFLEIIFLKNYSIKIPKKEVEKIGKFETQQNKIIFKDVEKSSAERKFNFLVEKHFGNLVNVVTKKHTIYIHKNSGIPLIGNTAFGIIYRNTNMIEVKPVTGCNLNCIYCSIDEGVSSLKKTDFLIEKDYLVQEIKKLADFIGEEWSCHIGTHGEPLLYPELKELIHDISKIPKVNAISMDTNATLLTEEIVDELIEAGLSRFNISLDALDEKIAQKMANFPYNLEHIKKISEYIGKKSEMLIAPVWVPGYNDNEIEKLVQFSLRVAKKSRIKMGIQNFLEYEYGRKPAKQMPWSEFYGKLKKLEEKYKTKLILNAEDFGIRKSKTLPKPFRKGEVIKAKVMCDGMYGNEKIAVSDNRSINVFGCNAKPGSIIKVKILRDKHNCFAGKQV